MSGADETWVYTGTRLSSDSKRCTAWLDADGKIHLYAERHTFVLGGEYTVHVTREGKSVRRGDPKYVRQRYDYSTELYKQWRLEELEADRILATMARERRDKGKDPFDDAMAPLLEYARLCKTATQRNALIADVIRRLTRGW